MEKILFLNEKDRNVGLNLKHSGYRYETAKPVTVAKPKRDGRFHDPLCDVSSYPGTRLAL